MARPSFLATAFLLLAGCAPAPVTVPPTAPATSPATAPMDIVQVNPQYAGPYEILEKKLTAEEVYYIFRGERGIFSFDLKPPPLSLKKVTFVLKDQGKLASLSIHPDEGRWGPLYGVGVDGPEPKSVKGLTMTREGRDWTAVFTGPALNLLRTGGRFQIIDEYRR